MQTTIKPRTMTVDDVAAELGIGLRQAYDALRRGDIPARKLGGTWIISRERFEQWLNGTEGAA